MCTGGETEARSGKRPCPRMCRGLWQSWGLMPGLPSLWLMGALDLWALGSRLLLSQGRERWPANQSGCLLPLP